MFKIINCCLLLFMLAIVYAKDRPLTFDCSFREDDVWIKPSEIRINWVNQTHLQLSCEMHSLYGGSVYWSINDTNSMLTSTSYIIDRYNTDLDVTTHSIISLLDLTYDVLIKSKFLCIGYIDEKVCKFPFVIHP